MKTKHIGYFLALAGLPLLNTSCSKSFLNVSPSGEVLQSNFYQSPSDALQALTAAYNPLGWETGGSDNTYIDKLLALNCASDECGSGGGGSTDTPPIQAINDYTMSGAVGPQAGLWDRNYTGIANANLVLGNVTSASQLTPAEITEYYAEAKFLRAYYYFDLVREFGNIPLITHVLGQSEWFTQVQVSPDTIYAQIESDLTFAITNLPVTAIQPGRATLGAANALMGKVILTENNTSRMASAAQYLDAVNNSGVYSLLPNYGDLFKVANKFNSESIFEIVHTNSQQAGWGNWPNFLGNVYVNMIGARSYSGPTYWSDGYGFNPVTTAYVALLKNDPRYAASIINIDSLVAANASTGASYAKGYLNTGYFINKFAPIQANIAPVGQTELNWPNDYIEIRLADTYLMEAEALVRGGGDVTKAQGFLDKVRARVGLPSIPATLSNIYAERQLELAFEGHRWFDLQRTNTAASVLASKGYQANNNILPIPLVELNNTKLKQNPGYQ
jgi:hypothetical protein